jgi:hydrogenase maturation protein HypF
VRDRGQGTEVTGTARRERRRVVVRGLVQGVGFRPHVHALARSLHLAGSVRNDAAGVVAEVEGDPADVAAFCARVGAEAPPLAHVEAVTWAVAPPTAETAFEVHGSAGGPGRTLVSPDVGICADCLADLQDPAGRRYRHPFVTCTHCGPRFTIVRALPYDRATTTMAGFALCAACAREYADPTDRRFHAQTVCCPDCGPRVSLHRPHRDRTWDEEALAEARRLLAGGAVVAVKGIGGYHLACDAGDETAVATLRKRKGRGDKPFAVLVADAAAAAALVELTAADRDLLAGPARPVVLAPARPGAPVAPSVAPGSADLGVLLPAAPLHHLLLGLPGDPPGPAALVLTSGNLAGEPIVTDDEEALVRLAALADAWLTHDRPVHVACDDSVTRTVQGVQSPVRRSRGFAPLPLTLPFEVPALLAVGADLKNAFCLAEGRSAWLSAHVGDLSGVGDLATLRALAAGVPHLERLTGVAPTALAADRHPAYRSRRWAHTHAAGRPVLEVQHHHAHVAATMAEHGVPDGERVLGVAFDGTGYGEDGAAWGGELLVADYRGFTRAAHLGYVPLPGGDAGVRNPCRMALSHLRSAGVPWDDRLPPVRACGPDELRLLDRQLEGGLRCVPTSSMGRLFDAVASLAGVCHRAGYDAQAAMELEALARRAGPAGAAAPGYAFGVSDRDGVRVADPGPVLAEAASDVLAGAPAEMVAARFHRAVVDLVVALAVALREDTGLRTVTLSGGVFLNALLTAGCADALAGAGLRVLRHRVVPPSDAGIALGQAAVLAASTRPAAAAPVRPERPARPARPAADQQEEPCA